MELAYKPNFPGFDWTEIEFDADDTTSYSQVCELVWEAYDLEENDEDRVSLAEELREDFRRECLRTDQYIDVRELLRTGRFEEVYESGCPRDARLPTNRPDGHEEYTMKTMKIVTLYWDEQDQQNEGWAWRMSSEHGDWESGALAARPDASREDLILAFQEQVTALTDDDIVEVG